MPSPCMQRHNPACACMQVWDSRTGQLVRLQQGHKGMVTSLFFSNTVRLLFSGSIDSTVGIWTDKGINLQVRRLVVQAHSHYATSTLQCMRIGTLRTGPLSNGYERLHAKRKRRSS